MSKHNHWVPSTKYALVDALTRRWPQKRSALNRLPKNQLFAIWFGIWPDCPGCGR
jgi:hypothetical protein